MVQLSPLHPLWMINRFPEGNTPSKSSDPSTTRSSHEEIYQRSSRINPRTSRSSCVPGPFNRHDSSILQRQINLEVSCAFLVVLYIAPTYVPSLTNTMESSLQCLSIREMLNQTICKQTKSIDQHVIYNLPDVPNHTGIHHVNHSVSVITIQGLSTCSQFNPKISAQFHKSQPK